MSWGTITDQRPFETPDMYCIRKCEEKERAKKHPSEEYCKGYMNDQIRFTSETQIDLVLNMINELGLRIGKLESLIKEQNK